MSKCESDELRHTVRDTPASLSCHSKLRSSFVGLH
jgi:hypothetical protein